jgi:hypothetical protein
MEPGARLMAYMGSSETTQDRAARFCKKWKLSDACEVDLVHEMDLVFEDAVIHVAPRAWGSVGGSYGGKARAEKLSPERRSEIAAQAARARWSRGK